MFYVDVIFMKYNKTSFSTAWLILTDLVGVEFATILPLYFHPKNNPMLFLLHICLSWPILFFLS